MGNLYVCGGACGEGGVEEGVKVGDCVFANRGGVCAEEDSSEVGFSECVLLELGGCHGGRWRVKG